MMFPAEDLYLLNIISAKTEIPLGWPQSLSFQQHTSLQSCRSKVKQPNPWATKNGKSELPEMIEEGAKIMRSKGAKLQQCLKMLSQPLCYLDIKKSNHLKLRSSELCICRLSQEQIYVFAQPMNFRDLLGRPTVQRQKTWLWSLSLPLRLCRTNPALWLSLARGRVAIKY